MTEALKTYRDLLAKVDAKFAAIAAAHPGSLHCGRGCHSCCKPGLTVNALEAESLRLYFEAHPEAQARLEALARTNPHGGSRCSLLDETGACIAYEARPVVCRSHGVPLKVLDQDRERLDVCPLNFVGEDLEALPQGDWVHLETLNTLLSLLSRQFSGDVEKPRTPLTASGLARSTHSTD